MTTPRAPNAPNPYHRGELLPTVRVDDDGEDLGGQDHLIALGNARHLYDTEAKKASRNLTNDFNYETNEYKAPSTPTKVGTRRKKRHGGAQFISTPPSTPPMSPRELVPPGAPRRPTARELAIRNAEENIAVERPQPQRLFTGRDITRPQQGRPSQGGAKHKRAKRSHKKTKHSKRSHKKTRRAHKKSKSHRKRR